MNREQLEFAISQYVDGTLDPAARAALEQRLAGDDEARQLLAQDRALQDLLGQLPAVPAVNWQRLAEHIGEGVAAAQPQGDVRLRIRPTWAVRLAMAAALLLAAAGVTVSVYLSNHASPSGGGASFAQVRILNTEAAKPAGVAQVSVGPSAAIAAEPAAMRYSDVIISRPSRVTIAAGDSGADDQVQPH